MAKITCAYSGIEFSCEHMPLALSSREYHHPLFNIPKRKLLSLTGEWSRHRLSETESYLLYLSLLHSTDHMVWNSPAKYTERTKSIVANNMELLVNIIGKIDLIQHPNFVIPKIFVSPDTADLTNSYHWICSWINCYDDWMQGNKDAALHDKLVDRQVALERMIKSSTTKPQDLANRLADWAEDAADFPDHLILNPIVRTGPKVIKSAYWKSIIKACVNEDKIYRYPLKDVEELIFWCEDTDDMHFHGSIYAAKLMQILRAARDKMKDPFGFGEHNVDMAGKTTSFRILSPESNNGDANIFAAIQSAPDSEPKRNQYVKEFDYIKAKMKWDMKLRHAAPTPVQKDGE
jgi:hypothetical protein